MSIKSVVTNDTTLTIEVGEKFDFSLVTDFREAYAELPGTVRQIDINLANTQYMDSSALGMLLNMQKVLSDRNLNYRIINCRPPIARILEISRFNKKFEIN